MPLNQRKFREAVLYFVHTCNPDTLGRVKLMKLLYYLDFDHLERYRRSVTGDTYVHLEHGPVPKSSWNIIQDMDGSDIKVTEVDVGAANPRHNFAPLRDFDLSIFSESERQMLKAVSARWKYASTEAIRDASHREAPWMLTEMKADVPKDLALCRHPNSRPSPEFQEHLLQSIVSSMRQEGIEIPEDEARALFKQAEASFWPEAAEQA